jgi:iron complex transport system substrate-binding protein
MELTKHSLKMSVVLSAFMILSGMPAGCSSWQSPTPENSKSPEPVTLADGLGNQVHLPYPAQRVVSLAPANTEILFAVGAGTQIVGRDTFSDYPEQANSITDIGGGFSDLNTEVIVSLKPDLVLASVLTAPEQTKALQELGFVVFTLANPTDFAGMFENLRTVAILTGHQAQTEELIGKLDQRVKEVEKKMGMVAATPLVFYELDGTDPNAPWTPGPGSFVGQIIQMAGGKNLGAALDSEWAQVSIEQLIAMDPDIILIGDATWGGVTLEDVSKRAGWKSLRAIQQGKIATFDDNLVSRPGPRMVDGLEAMAKLLHPELFQ